MRPAHCALALSGKLDAYSTANWDGGHIKFWSRHTLTTLLHETGFHVVALRGAGRWPWLWKSMLLAARKPLAQFDGTSPPTAPRPAGTLRPRR